MNEKTPPKLSDVLAIERTRMAAERTLMGWVRTALSLIGFGFTLFKFLESMQSKELGAQALRQNSPQTVGITLIGIGLFSLIVACAQHWNYARKLRSAQSERHLDLALVVAVLLGLLGLIMIVSILFRAGPFG